MAVKMYFSAIVLVGLSLGFGCSDPSSPGPAAPGNQPVPRWRVIYSSDGSTGGKAPTDAATYLAGDTVTIPLSPDPLVKSNYRLDFWNDRPDRSGASSLTHFTMADDDTTMYPVWMPEYLTTEADGTGIKATGGTVPASGLVEVPNGVTSLGMASFYAQAKLTQISLPKTLTTIAANAIRNTGLAQLEIPPQVTLIDYMALAENQTLKSLVLPTNLVTLGPAALAWSAQLETITIPASVQVWSYSTFIHCPKLSSVSVSDGITEVPVAAFADCPSLKSVSLPPSVNRVGEDAFMDCVGLESITIPAAVANIDKQAFSGCTSLVSVTLLATQPPALPDDAFAGCPAGLVFHVPSAAAVADYDAAPGWSLRAGRYVFP